VRHHVFRAIFLFLASWPLLMPPGMCLCQFVGGADIAGRSLNYRCAKDRDDPCPNACCKRQVANCGPCGKQRMPTDEQHAPGCPANKKSDHSKLLERYRPLLTATELASAPLSSCLDLSRVQRLSGSSLVFKLPAQLIYLALCSLVI
jgi:hypothetical protein